MKVEVVHGLACNKFSGSDTFHMLQHSPHPPNMPLGDEYNSGATSLRDAHCEPLYRDGHQSKHGVGGLTSIHTVVDCNTVAV